EGLSAQGLRVDCAATGEQAIELARTRAYDALLCDVNLGSGGVHGGLQIAKKIRAASLGGSTEIVFMTGDLVEPQNGQDDFRYIQKPFRISEVLTLLGEVLAPSPATKSSN